MYMLYAHAHYLLAITCPLANDLHKRAALNFVYDIFAQCTVVSQQVTNAQVAAMNRKCSGQRMYDGSHAQ